MGDTLHAVNILSHKTPGPFIFEQLSENSTNFSKFRYKNHPEQKKATLNQKTLHSDDDFDFKNKIDAVRASTAATPLDDVSRRDTPTLTELPPVSSDGVDKLINSAPNKTCQLDPALTWLVKDMSGLLSPSSPFYSPGVVRSFPAEFKQAVVRPLLKKEGAPHPSDRGVAEPLEIRPSPTPYPTEFGRSRSHGKNVIKLK